MVVRLTVQLLLLQLYVVKFWSAVGPALSSRTSFFHAVVLCFCFCTVRKVLGIVFIGFSD